ncbi:prephenate/arogenate dehydrogenase family protein [Sneathiella sp. HT1-7]|uniref:prephenate/arogenate dehydrogenase family protein n=1 Tax=Sneathiella sp. HT1-7 TaxID=2887192 RepID=UPI001D14A9F2|nr:prephenate/arogenate dehydrogenase family protein [Sneathiella sp. HT1-7]MCC3304119.1 prephenate/arogenate dehydrogenase family protein [Sneathiella sp. HT1-7]
MTEVKFKRLALIGIGLIGSSIARSVRQHNLADEIVCAARTADSRRVAKELGIVDAAYESPKEAVKGADLVILCTPIGTYEALAKEIAPMLEKGAIVTDVGSVKGAVVKAIGPNLPSHAEFIPGHPVAGTEKSGPAAGFAELFINRWLILTPCGQASDAAVAKLSDFWAAMGSKVEIMDPDHHDLVLAITSHIPHLIAYNIVGTADDLEDVTQSEVIKYSAGGFRDFTRIAASDPTMWRDVFLHNKEAVLEMLGRFTEDLTALQRAIRRDDGDTLFNIFSRTRAIRRQIIDAGQETPEPDFGRVHTSADTPKKSE